MGWIKIERGFYGLRGTCYAVQSDGYESSKSIGATAHYEGFTGGEWAVIRFRGIEGWRDDMDDGENLDWFSTMREARDWVARHLG
jgi:hypothetical protein